MLNMMGKTSEAEKNMAIAREYAASLIKRAKNSDSSFRLAFDKPDSNLGICGTSQIVALYRYTQKKAHVWARNKKNQQIYFYYTATQEELTLNILANTQRI